MPVGMRSALPGGITSGSATHARRSMPAEPGVAYNGRCERMRSSRILRSMVVIADFKRIALSQSRTRTRSALSRCLLKDSRHSAKPDLLKDARRRAATIRHYGCVICVELALCSHRCVSGIGILRVDFQHASGKRKRSCKLPKLYEILEQ